MHVFSFVMPANACSELRSQTVTSDDHVIIHQINFSDELFRSFQSNIKPCETNDLSHKLFRFDNVNTCLIIHINISSLHMHIEELKDFLNCLQYPPSLIFLSETRIKNRIHRQYRYPRLYFCAPSFFYLSWWCRRKFF